MFVVFRWRLITGVDIPRAIETVLSVIMALDIQIVVVF